MDYVDIIFFGGVGLSASLILWKGRTDFSLWAGYGLISIMLFLNIQRSFGAGPLDSALQKVADFTQTHSVAVYFLPAVILVYMLWQSGYLLEGYRCIRDLGQPRKPRGYTSFETGNSKSSAALMGTATTNFEDHALSVRDVALIRLAIYMGGGLSQKFNVALSQKLALPLSYKASYQNELSRSLNSHTDRLSTIIRPLMREAWGNYDIPQRMLGDLCDIAKQSGSVNTETTARLKQIAKQLKLPQDLVGQFI